MNRTSTKKTIVSSSKKASQNAGNCDEFPFEPSAHIIANLLNYSKALNISPSQNIGQFELVLN